MSVVDKSLEKIGYVNMADILTPKAKREIKKNHVLGFSQTDGSVHHYIITHINKKSDKFYAKRLNRLYAEEEIKAELHDRIEEKRKNGNS